MLRMFRRCLRAYDALRYAWGLTRRERVTLALEIMVGGDPARKCERCSAFRFHDAPRGFARRFPSLTCSAEVVS